MTDILRGEWGFTGYVFSDAGAVEGVMSHFNVTQNMADAAALVINAGTNLDLVKRPVPVFTALGMLIYTSSVFHFHDKVLVHTIFCTFFCLLTEAVQSSYGCIQCVGCHEQISIEWFASIF